MVEVMAEAAPRVLVVEDEPALAQLLVTYLERDGYQVEACSDGAVAVGAARSFNPEVVVLDLGLPGLDGVEVCRELRRFSDCYVVMLTARDDEVDKLIGLSVGADDYLTKPFSTRELLARIRVLRRRPRRPALDTGQERRAATVGALRLDREAREVLVDGREVELTPTEFELLAALVDRPRMVWSRRQLIDAVWGSGWVGDERMVDVHVRNVRRKLGDDAAASRFVRTVRGAGYRLGPG
jgi:DNA-binding response OmpR family regulator